MMQPSNFARVDGRVWRGGWPSPAAAEWLTGWGVRTDIDLEWEEDDASLFASIVRVVRIADFEPLPWFAPSLADAHVISALRAIIAGPPIVYVHCRSGQNRTGVIVAAYRLLLRDDPLDAVLADFASYRGLWAWGDERYIRSLPPRRGPLLERISDR